MMPLPKIIAFGQQSISPALDRPRPDRLVQGNPSRQTWEHYVNRDGVLSCGIWACEVGAWRIRFADNKDEFFCVIEGRVRLRDDAGEVVEIGAGEAAVIPAGFSGIFEVLQPVRKYFAVLEQRSVD